MDLAKKLAVPDSSVVRLAVRALFADGRRPEAKEVRACYLSSPAAVEEAASGVTTIFKSGHWSFFKDAEDALIDALQAPSGEANAQVLIDGIVSVCVAADVCGPDASINGARPPALCQEVLWRALISRPQAMAPLLAAVDALLTGPRPALALLEPFLVAVLVDDAPPRAAFAAHVLASLTRAALENSALRAPIASLLVTCVGRMGAIPALQGYGLAAAAVSLCGREDGPMRASLVSSLIEMLISQALPVTPMLALLGRLADGPLLFSHAASLCLLACQPMITAADHAKTIAFIATAMATVDPALPVGAVEAAIAALATLPAVSALSLPAADAAAATALATAARVILLKYSPAARRTAPPLPGATTPGAIAWRRLSLAWGDATHGVTLAEGIAAAAGRVPGAPRGSGSDQVASAAAAALLLHPSPRVVTAAACAVAALAAASPSAALPLLPAVLFALSPSRPGHAAVSLIMAIPELARHPAAFGPAAAALRRLSSTACPPTVRALAIRATQRLVVTAGPGRGLTHLEASLRGVAEPESPTYLRAAAAAAAGAEIGRDGSTASSHRPALLRAALADGDPRVRAVALVGLTVATSGAPFGPLWGRLSGRAAPTHPAECAAWATLLGTAAADAGSDDSRSGDVMAALMCTARGAVSPVARGAIYRALARFTTPPPPPPGGGAPDPSGPSGADIAALLLSEVDPVAAAALVPLAAVHLASDWTHRRRGPAAAALAASAAVATSLSAVAPSQREGSFTRSLLEALARDVDAATGGGAAHGATCAWAAAASALAASPLPSPTAPAWAEAAAVLLLLAKRDTPAAPPPDGAVTCGDAAVALIVSHAGTSPPLAALAREIAAGLASTAAGGDSGAWGGLPPDAQGSILRRLPLIAPLLSAQAAEDLPRAAAASTAGDGCLLPSLLSGLGGVMRSSPSPPSPAVAAAVTLALASVPCPPPAPVMAALMDCCAAWDDRGALAPFISGSHSHPAAAAAAHAACALVLAGRLGGAMLPAARLALLRSGRGGALVRSCLTDALTTAPHAESLIAAADTIDLAAAEVARGAAPVEFAVDLCARVVVACCPRVAALGTTPADEGDVGVFAAAARALSPEVAAALVGPLAALSRAVGVSGRGVVEAAAACAARAKPG